MANLIYCATERGMEAWSDELQKRGLEKPFMMKGAGDIPGAIEALKSGQDVIAHARPETVTGWRAPKGTSVVLDEDMERPERRAMSAQARMRAPLSAPQLHPHQERMIQEIMKMDPDELSERLGNFGMNHRQHEGRFYRPFCNRPVVTTVSFHSIMTQIAAKRDAKNIGQMVPKHDLEEGLSLVNAVSTTGTLIIAKDRFDAHVEIKKHPGGVNLDEPSKIESAHHALLRGYVVVTTADMIPFGLARKTDCQIQLTEQSMQDAGAARVAIRMCRERLSSPVVTLNDTPVPG